MALHQASGRWKLGLLLALVTAACWATLPVALKITLGALDPYTLTWFRFVLAGGALLAAAAVTVVAVATPVAAASIASSS